MIKSFQKLVKEWSWVILYICSMFQTYYSYYSSNILAKKIIENLKTQLNLNAFQLR